MAKLRHIAIAVPDIEKAAKFYETTFGLARVLARVKRWAGVVGHSSEA